MKHLLGGLRKSDGLIHVVENSVVFSHKDITQDPLWARRREVHTHEGEEARTLGLDHRLLSRDGVLVATNRKDDIRDLIERLAVNSVFSHDVGLGPDRSCQLGYFCLGSSHQRGTGVHNRSDLIVASLLAVVTSFDAVQCDLPVSSLLQLHCTSKMKT